MDAVNNLSFKEDMRDEKTEPWLWNSPNPLDMSSCISGHLDVSPCHAVIICHTPKTLESASIMCSLQSNIYSAQNYSKYLPLLSRSKHMRGGKTVPATQWLGSSQSLYWGWSHNNMFCVQCSSLLVPRGWSRLSDITTLSSRLPTCAQCSWGCTDRHCISDELLSLISNTRYLSPIFLCSASCRGHNILPCSNEFWSPPFPCKLVSLSAQPWH